MASRSRRYTTSAADPTGRFRPPLTAEQRAHQEQRQAEREEFDARMANLKYASWKQPYTHSMSKNADKLPLFWIGYFIVVALFLFLVSRL